MPFPPLPAKSSGQNLLLPKEDVLYYDGRKQVQRGLLSRPWPASEVGGKGPRGESAGLVQRGPAGRQPEPGDPHEPGGEAEILPAAGGCGL